MHYSHPGDQHLAVVLARRNNDNTEVCWLCNLQDPSMNLGHYGADARKSFMERISNNCMYRAPDLKPKENHDRNSIMNDYNPRHEEQNTPE
jgi:hypothetical protein